MSRRNKKAWPSFLGVRAGSGVAAASGALVLFLLASFLAVVALDVGGGPKEGTSGDQLRDYVEVGYIFNFRMGNLSDVVFYLSNSQVNWRSYRFCEDGFLERR